MDNGYKFEYEVDRQARLAREKEITQHRIEEEARERAEEAYKEEIRLLKKANKAGKTVKEIKAEEKAKKEERYIKAKIKRYTKEIEEMEKILAYKKAWLNEHKTADALN